MSIGSVSRGKRRVVVELDPSLADNITAAATARSSRIRKVTASDIIREAVAAFLLSTEATNTSHPATETSIDAVAAGSIE